MITSANFKIKFPEFTSTLDAKINLLIDEAYLFIGENKYQDTLVLYWTAHNLVVQQNQLSGDYSPIVAVASEGVGNVNTSYANPQMNNSDILFYMSTSYGQKYLEYKRALCVGNARLV